MENNENTHTSDTHTSDTHTSDTQSNTSSASDSSLHDNSPTHILIDVRDSNDIELGHIQEETNLIQYTDTHFTHVTNTDLYKLRNEYRHTTEHCSAILHNNFTRPDSPMTISNYGSRSGSSNNSDCDTESASHMNLRKQISLDDISKSNITVNTAEIRKRKHKPHKPHKPHKRQSTFKQLAFHDVEKTLDKYYDMELENKYSSEIDILTTFMKGQKNVYIQAKQLSQWRLNCLMIPSLLITFGITIFSDFISCNLDYNWILTTLNASVALLIALMNFLKLESSTNMFLQLANHYDKLEASLEMTNSKMVLMDTDNEKKLLGLSQLKIIEEKMNEMKEINKIIVPAEIKTLFPIICHVNIFSFIKKLENHRQIMILKFKDIKNEIRFILHKWEKEEHDIDDLKANILQQKTRDKQREQNRLNFLYEIKDKLKIELNDYRSAYACMDDIFTNEIKHAETETNRFCIWLFCLWKSQLHYKRLDNINPVLDKYFHFLFTED